MALLFSRPALVALSSSLPKKPLTSSLWRFLCELGIARYKPTRRGCRAGTRKQRPFLTCEGPPLLTSLSDHSLCEIHPEIPFPSQEPQVGNNLHISPSNPLNIHLVTSESGNPNSNTSRGPPDARDVQALRDNQIQRSHYVPKIMLSNVMSLLPKLTEVQEFIFRNEVGLAFFTETWLREDIADSVVNIPGYTVLRRDRTFESQGGVCFYIRNDLNWKYNQLEDLKCCDHHTVLWVLLKPTRLPRGFPRLVTATVYHPKQNVETDASLREHLFDSLTLAEARYPNCAFVVCGDFNRFNTQQLTNHFRLKQIV